MGKSEQFEKPLLLRRGAEKKLTKNFSMHDRYGRGQDSEGNGGLFMHTAKELMTHIDMREKVRYRTKSLKHIGHSRKSLALGTL